MCGIAQLGCRNDKPIPIRPERGGFLAPDVNHVPKVFNDRTQAAPSQVAWREKNSDDTTAVRDSPNLFVVDVTPMGKAAADPCVAHDGGTVAMAHASRKPLRLT